ncbi:type II secretion system F family protein [Roseomonas sp. 18066]|uniref:type II secretion system F family protein n=1 Tax=Roseomonas sp. 18066 TaxID=2681412 RepID=UPI00135B8E05|nr:type II secretion system F family protein [Roseomonas sp. 18066]
MRLLPLLLLALLLLLLLGGLALLLLARQRGRQARRWQAVFGPHRATGAATAAAPAARPRALLERLSPLLGLEAYLAHRPGRQAWRPLLPALPGAALLCWLTAPVLDDWVWLAWPALALLGLRLLAQRAEAQRRQLLYVQFPDALGMIVRAVRVGVPVTESLRVVAREALAPTSQEFTRLADLVAIGQPLEEALGGMARQSGLPEYRFFAVALALQSQTGGSLNETLDNLADVIRRRVALRARARALATEARTSAIVLGCLPVLAAGGLYVVSPSYILVLVEHPTGHKILAGAGGLLLCGVLVMRGMLKKALQ